jgi:hypothetical protein
VLSLAVVTVSSFPPPLPHAADAVIAAAKLRDYTLNPDHPDGGPKARVFAAVFGYSRQDWPQLREALLAAIQEAPAMARAGTAWGQLYDVSVTITGVNGRAHRVRTGWIVRPDDPRPHLVTCYVQLP